MPRLAWTADTRNSNLPKFASRTKEMGEPYKKIMSLDQWDVALGHIKQTV